MQNYFHAVLGLLIIALAFYQVRTGYKTEWPNTTGRGDVSNGIDIVWYIWVVVSFSSCLLVIRPLISLLSLSQCYISWDCRSSRSSTAKRLRVGRGAGLGMVSTLRVLII